MSKAGFTAALNVGALIGALGLSWPAFASGGYQIFVSNERSNDLTIIDPADFSVIATVPVGQRPRGIHASPDGKFVYVALSGTPVAAPPQLDAHGNPIMKRGKDDDDDGGESDKRADAIAVVDVLARKVSDRIFVGSDPEEFALSKDGTHLYVSNEDTSSASVVSIAAKKVEHIIPVGQEPEGVATTPDGKRFYVTCESGGLVYVVDTANYGVVGHFKVNPRPRTVAFLPQEPIAFIPSESAGELNVVDTAQLKVLKVITLPQGARPMSARLSQDAHTLYLSTGRSGTVLGFDTHSYELLTTARVGTRPWGLAVSPDGKYLFSANGPSNDISVVDLKTNQEVRRVKAGSSPWSVAIVPVQ